MTTPVSGHPEGPERTEELTYRTVADETASEEVAIEGQDGSAPEALIARTIRLPDGTRLRQLLVDRAARKTGYERLDNEILAGLRLARLAPAGSYPLEVSRLHGFEPSAAEPFALVERYRGEPVTSAARHLLPDDQHAFQVSLLTAVCWLAEAGVAHRGIRPSTVWWDGAQVQITDFSLATLVGAPREAIGTPPWAAPEQRPGRASGVVSARDDIWAAGRLIYHVRTGKDLTDRSQLSDVPGLEQLLADVFGRPEDRPTARQLLTGPLGAPCPVLRGRSLDPLLEEGRKRFVLLRSRKHPDAAPLGEPEGPAGPAAVPLAGRATAAGPDPDPAPATAGPRAARRRSRIIGGLTTVVAFLGTVTLPVR